jgi:hypothetical protein
MPTKLIGISGLARSGKDTLASALVRKAAFWRPELKIARYAFANALKNITGEFCWNTFGIKIFTDNTKEKEIIRPLLVGVGSAARLKNPRYWIEIVEKQIAAEKPAVAIITDVRFAEHDSDELKWIKTNGKLIHVERTENGVAMSPPNSEEKRNNPKLKKAADFRVIWESSENERALESAANEWAEKFFDKHLDVLY